MLETLTRIRDGARRMWQPEQEPEWLEFQPETVKDVEQQLTNCRCRMELYGYEPVWQKACGYIMRGVIEKREQYGVVYVPFMEDSPLWRFTHREVRGNRATMRFRLEEIPGTGRFDLQPVSAILQF